jgi:hypothetical protein
MYYALLKLGFTDADFSLRDDSDGKGTYIDEWLSDKQQPSASEIQTAQDEYQAEYDSKAYSRDRATAYASLQEQADMQYWDSVNGTTVWQEHIAEIKAKHPKE